MRTLSFAVLLCLADLCLADMRVRLLAQQLILPGSP